MNLQLERGLIALAMGAVVAMASRVGLRGAGMSAAAAVVVGLLLGLAVAVALARRLPADLDGLAKTHRWWCAAWLLVAALAVVQTARASAFMLDPTAKESSLFPNDPWYVAHNCLTAYTESARFATSGETNVYRSELYLDRKMGTFNIDAYLYPPPFLLFPLALKAVAGTDYPHERMVWFGVSALALLAALAAVAGALEPASRRRAIAAMPAIWLSVPVQVGFQMSNVQLLIVSISVLSWFGFRRARPVGGALLALATVGKIFPGVLALYLVFRRRWRDAIVTAAFGLIFCGAIYAVVGPAPFHAFVDYELPRLSSGESFCRPFSRAFAVAHNMAPFGIPLKLEKLGVPGAGFSAGRWISTLYGLTIVALALWAARRPRTPEAAAPGIELPVWLALLSLGTLASPFAPASYVLALVVWLAAIDRENISPALAGFVWIATSAPFLLPREGDFLVRVLAYFPAQACALGVPAYVLWRAGRKVSRALPAST
ncbi:MAG: glycosyltransferase family 87 protein [Thermoanaerobaculia bacterium]